MRDVVKDAGAQDVRLVREPHGRFAIRDVMQKAGHLTPNQTVIALTVITLFIPCVANFLVMLKERGRRAGLAIAGFIIAYSFGIGFVMNMVFRLAKVSL